MADTRTDLRLDIDKVFALMKTYDIRVAQMGYLMGHGNSFISDWRARGGTIKKEDAERMAVILNVKVEDIIAKEPIADLEPQTVEAQQIQPVPVKVIVNTAEIEDLLGKVYRTNVGTRNELKAISERLYELLTEVRKLTEGNNGKNNT